MTTYVLVRRDIPIGNQLAQVGHACQEAGALFRPPVPAGRMVVLSVKDEESLLRAALRIDAAGVRIHVFEEPDFPKGHTAACTEPTDNERPFKSLPLWVMA